MPTYEFRCSQSHVFEKLYRTISGAEAQAKCPECGQSAERVMSAAGFSFKGSGFYLTDYGKNAHREKSPSDSKGETGADGAGGDTKARTTSDGAAPSAAGAAGADSKHADSKTSEPTKSEPTKSDTKPAVAKPAAPSAKKSPTE